MGFNAARGYPGQEDRRHGAARSVERKLGPSRATVGARLKMTFTSRAGGWSTPLPSSSSATVRICLQPVRRRQAAVGFTGAGVGGRGAVPLEHRAGLPASDAHEVGLGAALGEPLVREGVPELVRM
jgi:hypothetical protein